jgi:hypothetical protein
VLTVAFLSGLRDILGDHVDLWPPSGFAGDVVHSQAAHAAEDGDDQDLVSGSATVLHLAQRWH